MKSGQPNTIDKLHSFEGKPADPDSVIAFEGKIDQLGNIVTFEVVGCKRDGKDIRDIVFYSFHHELAGWQTCVKFQYNDFGNIVAEHDYELNVMFHFEC